MLNQNSHARKIAKQIFNSQATISNNLHNTVHIKVFPDF